jgi:hypothetical protein
VSDVDITASLFVAAALMFWLGWMLLPFKPGPFFRPKDFAAISDRFHSWIWLYRVHLFGHIAMLMAFVALGALYSKTAPPVLVWPAVAVLGVAAVVAALAQAFYYHFGAWGALHPRSDAESEAHVRSLALFTEYMTCLTRFGRVFLGLGQVVLAIALSTAFPIWLALATAILGIAAMAVTMAFPDNLEYYEPLFHLNALWLAVVGIVLFLSSV